MSLDGARDLKWEYNCPQFVDFSEPQTLDDNADEWFDYDHENEEGIPLDAPPSPEHEGDATAVAKGTETLQKMQQAALAATAAPVVKVEPHAETQEKKDKPEFPAVVKEEVAEVEPTAEVKAEPQVEVVVMQPGKPAIQFTAVTDAPVADTKKMKAKTEATRVRRSIRRKSFVKTAEQRAKEFQVEPANKKQKTAANERRSAPNTAAPRVRHASGKTRRSADTSAGPPEKKAKPSADPKTRVKLTMPKTPECAKRSYKRPGLVKKTSEQLELEKIEQMREETRRKHQIAEESYKQAQASAGYHATRAAVPLTKPHEFHFQTDQRVKEHTMETRQDMKNNKRFEDSLRTHPPSPVSGSRAQAKCNKVTKPKPFKFTHESRKRKLHEVDHVGADKWHSVSEQVINFHKKTPDRFRRKAKADLNATRGPVVGDHKMKLTHPQTPNFTRPRTRPVHVKSAAEIEEEEVEEMKNYKFKAREIDQRIFQQTGVGVPKKTHKSTTHAVGIELETDRRIQVRQEEAKLTENNDKFEFHARPVPAKILEGPVGLAEKKVAPLTVPESPAFALKNRVRSVRPEADVEEKEDRIMWANPIPHSGVPFKPNREHKTTQLEPFSFQHREEDRLARKGEKIQQKIQEEAKLASSFRAQDLPASLHEPAHLPDVPKKAPTNPAPFHLSYDDRGAKKAAEWSKKMEEELKKQREQASSFRHRPADVLYKEPFVAQKATKPLTDVSEFDLNTVRRAEQRQEFEMHKKMKEEEIESMRLQQEAEQREQEQIEIARLRKELVHKANPIRHGRPLEIQPSDKPLTNPQSPNFTDRRRKASVRF